MRSVYAASGAIPGPAAARVRAFGAGLEGPALGSGPGSGPRGPARGPAWGSGLGSGWGPAGVRHFGIVAA